MAGSIVVVGVLIRCALFYSVCDLKAAEMNVQRSLIPELIFYALKLGYNAMEETQNIFGRKMKAQLITIQ